MLFRSLIVLVVRSRRPFFRSRPSKRLLWATLSVAATTLVMPFLPFAPSLGLTPLPLPFLGLVGVIVAMYIVSGELAKRIFYCHFDPTRSAHP